MWHPNVTNGRIRLVYIDEAHVAGEWPLNHLTASDRTEDPHERLLRATALRSDVEWLIDTCGLARVLGAWPELFVTTSGGRITERTRNVTNETLNNA